MKLLTFPTKTRNMYFLKKISIFFLLHFLYYQWKVKNGKHSSIAIRTCRIQPRALVRNIPFFSISTSYPVHLPTKDLSTNPFSRTLCSNRTCKVYQNSVISVRKRSIPTEQPPHVGEISAHFPNKMAPRGPDELATGILFHYEDNAFKNKEICLTSAKQWITVLLKETFNVGHSQY
jgi:hypothetical protein